MKAKIIPGLDHSPHNISTIIRPFLLDNTDPKYRAPKKFNLSQSIKYLTIYAPWPIILNTVIKLKDGKMTRNKNPKKTSK